MLGLDIENGCLAKGVRIIAGIDEAGRGPLAGPVVSAAVIFPPGICINGVDDSKKLNEAERNELFLEIGRSAISIGVGVVGHETIDRVNILNATFRSMIEAIGKLPTKPDYLLIDGPRFPGCGIPFETIVDGDAKCFSIAAASIVAKVTRDNLMKEYDRIYPQYGFERNKGYGKKDHMEALRKYGPCEIHRRSFTLPTVSRAPL